MMFTLCLLCYIFLLFTSGIWCKDSNCDDDVTSMLRLKCNLFKDYIKTELPVENRSEPLHVNLTMYPVDINLNEYEKELTLTAWMNMTWTDCFLIWDPENYEGIRSLKIGCDDIWHPSLIPLNLFASNPQDKPEDMLCQLYSNGTVVIVFTPTYSAHCDSDFRHWPYDKHNCSISVGHNQFVGSNIKFHIQEVLSHLLDNDKTWHITIDEALTKSHRINIDDVYVELHFAFILERHSTVHYVTCVFPAIVLTVLLLASLLLDILSAERLFVLGSVIFTEIVFLEFFSFVLPTSGNNTPYIACYYCDISAVCGFIILWSLLGRIISSMSMRPVWLTVTVNWISGNVHLERFLFTSLNAQSVSEPKSNEEETLSPLSLIAQKQREWRMFVEALDRLMLLLILMVVAYLIIKYYPVI